jgi:PEP-CTERM motif
MRVSPGEDMGGRAVRWIPSRYRSLRSKRAAAAIIAAVGCISTAHLARADVIQVNFLGGTGAKDMPGATSGAPGGDYSIWNNSTFNGSTGSSSGTISNLEEVSGTATTATAVYGPGNGGSTSVFNSNGVGTNNNQALLYQWIYFDGTITNGVSVTVSTLPSSYTDYDVYVYFESNTNVATGYVAIGSTSLYYTSSDSLGTHDTSADFIQATATSSTSVQADYAEFTNLTGSGFTIDLTNTSGNDNTGIAGFQIVQVVPEPASLACLSIGCAGLLLRRRRRPLDTLAPQRVLP